jgi:hypothetical protein
MDAGTPQVRVDASPRAVYGNLNGAGQDEAALNVWCNNTGGMADGQLKNTWVIFSADSGRLRAIGTLVPQQMSGPSEHIPYFDTAPGALTIVSKTITVHELAYGSADPTCCPSVRSTTVWTYANGTLRPTATTPTR